MLVINALHDIIARRCVDEETEKIDKLPIVYNDDAAEKIFSALETFTVVSSESMQHQNIIAVIKLIRTMFKRVSAEWQTRMEEVVLRMLAVLGEFALTRALDEELTALAAELDSGDRPETAAAVRRAHEKFALSVGKLNSRSTRVPLEN